MTPAPIILAVSITAVLGMDAWLGGKPERYGAGIMLASAALDLAYHAVVGVAKYASIDLGHLIMNAMCFIAFMMLALRANRVWPMWCAALQIIMALGHLGETVYPEGAPQAYWMMTFLPTLGQVVAISLGVAAHTRRFAELGRYRDWRVN